MSRKYRKDFYRAKRKLRIPYLIGIRVRALLHSLCPLLSLGIALSSTAIEASYQYGASCALAIVRSVRFRVEKQDEQQQTTNNNNNNNNKQTNNKLADAKSLSTLPSRDPFSTTIVLHSPRHSLSPRLQA